MRPDERNRGALWPPGHQAPARDRIGIPNLLWQHAAGLAIAVLAFIAVLPEYAVDVVFAGKAGAAVAAHGSSCVPPGSTEASPCSLALANMTGSNRLLIGIGWSMVVFVAWWQWRRRGQRRTEVRLERSHSIELAFLALATIYSLTLPLRHSITLIDAAVLFGIFAAYTWRIARSPAEEPHLVGPARYIGGFSVALKVHASGSSR